MDKSHKHYYRYQMTYPFESNKIYKSRSLKKVAHKCSKEFQRIDDIGEGMFCVTNLDKKVEYRFKIKKNRNLVGGDIKLNAQVNEVSKLGEDDDEEGEPVQIVVNQDKTIIDQLGKHDKAIKDLLGSIQKQITPVKEIKETPQTEDMEDLPVKPSTMTSQIKADPKTEDLEDLFEGVDPFDLNLKKLYAQQKMKNINKEDEDLCIIL